jgi:lysophospholipase L1-like esterase
LYPEILGERWGRRVINLSASGLRADQAISRYWDDIEKIQGGEVVACFVALGANDQLAGRTAAEAESDLREISERMRGNGWRVFVVQSIVPFRGKGYRDAYQRLAREAGTPLSSDIVGTYLGASGGVQHGDRSHPSAKGQALIAEKLDGDFGRIMTQRK